MSQDLVSYALDIALQSHCEYSEARFHRTNDVTCFTRNGEPEPAAISDAEGIGVRVVYDGALAFGATNILTKQSMKDLVERLVKNAKYASSVTKEKVHLSEEETHVQKWSAEEKKNIQDVSVDSMISMLRELDRTVSNPISGVAFPNRNLFLWCNVEEKFYINSDGSRLESRVPRAAYFGLLTSIHDGKPTTISVPPRLCAARR